MKTVRGGSATHIKEGRGEKKNRKREGQLRQMRCVGGNRGGQSLPPAMQSGSCKRSQRWGGSERGTYLERAV